MNIRGLSDWYAGWQLDGWRIISMALAAENRIDAAEVFRDFATYNLFDGDRFVRLDLDDIDVLWRFAFLRKSGIGHYNNEKNDGVIAAYKDKFKVHPFEQRLIARLFWEADLNGRDNFFRRKGYIDATVPQCDVMRLQWKLVREEGLWSPTPDFDSPLSEYHVPCRFFSVEPEGWVRVDTVDGEPGPYYRIPRGVPVSDIYLHPRHWSEAGLANDAPAHNMLLDYPCGQGTVQSNQDIRTGMKRMSLS